MFKTTKLSNGLKLITAPIAGTKTITVLMMYGTGSRYENKQNNGLSHFLEHMFFKGTTKRPITKIISSELDALGCEFNAFTTKEFTGYWIKVDSLKIKIALDILSDMLFNSKFSSAEIDRERGVIIEEINMYEENPMMYIENLFELCLYGDTPTGWDTAGTKENVKNLKRADFIKYFKSQYGVNSAVLCLAGDINNQTTKLAEKFFNKMAKSKFEEKLPIKEDQKIPAIEIKFKEGSQVNISLGVRAYADNHPDRTILKVLSVILGGSMSSRLFTEVRERRGLAYYVRTMAEFFTDCGYLTTQAGVPAEKVLEASKVILAEYKKLTKELVSKEELKRTKDLIKGKTIISFEASDDVASWYAQQAVMKKEVLTPEEYFAKLDKVTPADLRRVAKDIFKDEKLNFAVVGPFKNKDKFKDFLSFK